MPLQRPHQLVPVSGERYDFATRTGGGKELKPQRVTNRPAVAKRIVAEVEALVAAAREGADQVMDPTRIPMTVRATTSYGVFRGVPGRTNEVLSRLGFEARARLNVAMDPATLEKIEAASKKYAAWRDDGKRPQYSYFFEAQPEVALTEVEDLWASTKALPEDEHDEVALEVWLQKSSEPRLREVLETLGLKAPSALAFEDVRVIRVVSTLGDFRQLARSASITQLRPASALASHMFQVPTGVQAALVTAAAGRIVPAPDDAPAVCLLDTGVRADHPLLQSSLAHAASVVGGPAGDWDGHGTKMAGLALFPDLASEIAGRRPIELPIRLESVTVQGPPGGGGAGADRLPADRLRRAVDEVEGEADRLRTFCLAMNAPEDANDGGPSTLATEIDVLASDVAGQRLFCVAAGNIDDPLRFGDYQSMNDLSGMMAPAQAWNAITVAACTDLGPVPETHAALAPSGDLSPWSTTAVNWERAHRPPTKPDVVFEGGNQMYDRVSQAVGPHADLALLTTSMDLQAPLTLTGQTSAATAAISGLCASLQAEYAGLWPETVRGLVIHSAEHSDAMKVRAGGLPRGRRSYEKGLLERYGFGKPDRDRAMENAGDALTLINQAHLRPFRMNDAGKDVVLGQMRFHEMPWPIDALADLEGVEAELRVTLSYFVSPNPGEVLRGRDRSYASHGFNFDVKRPDETDAEAVARINKLHEKPRRSTPSLGWTFGPDRGRGSVKHDRLVVADAADLARMGGIMVFPTKGWWADDAELVDQQARYSLIATIRTPGQEIYTEIATAIPA